MTTTAGTVNNTEKVEWSDMELLVGTNNVTLAGSGTTWTITMGTSADTTLTLTVST
jgi:hypothetical protein